MIGSTSGNGESILALADHVWTPLSARLFGVCSGYSLPDGAVLGSATDPRLLALTP